MHIADSAIGTPLHRAAVLQPSLVAPSGCRPSRKARVCPVFGVTSRRPCGCTRWLRSTCSRRGGTASRRACCRTRCLRSTSSGGGSDSGLGCCRTRCLRSASSGRGSDSGLGCCRTRCPGPTDIRLVRGRSGAARGLGCRCSRRSGGCFGGRRGSRRRARCWLLILIFGLG